MTPREHGEDDRSAADRLYQDGRFEEAIVLYRNLAAASPGDDSLVLALAWACHDGGRLEEAIGLFESLFRKELARPAFTGFGFDELVRIFKDHGMHNRLVDLCERAATAQPDDFALSEALADAYLRAGRPRDAATVLEKMTEEEPEAAAVLCLLGNALLALSEWDRAETAYQRAVCLEPDKTGVFYGRMAHTLLELNQPQRALDAYVRCVSFRPEDPLYRCGLGDILLELDLIREALEAYERAISLNPEQTGACLNRLGHSLARRNLHEEAADAFRRAADAEPDNPLYPLHLAECLLALGREEEAEEILKNLT
jgi:tetratricopeptide (TPR) repeat protein